MVIGSAFPQPFFSRALCWSVTSVFLISLHDIAFRHFVEIPVKSHGSLYGVCDGPSDTLPACSPVLQFSPMSSFHQCFIHIIISITGAGTIGPFEAEVPREIILRQLFFFLTILIKNLYLIYTRVY
jgi:hypothetical protein